MNPEPAVFDKLQAIADPLADTCIAEILGEWPATSDNALADRNTPQWLKIAIVNQQFQQWKDNKSLQNWQPGKLDPGIGKALESYLQTAQVLPEWADPQQIARAETLFIDYGMLSCTLLFCASLPECYVIPNLADVLHVAGQLEDHTEYRIRSTAAMIFPVMMRGGLTQANGAGIAQILKVRLIHAMIRNLIMRGEPQAARTRLAGSAIPPLTVSMDKQNLYQTLFAHGWDPAAEGLPCNQEELAYTLLTFSYVFLRAMRTLGLGLKADDELAYLHAWNVVGHVLGMRRDLMADTMEQAESLFSQMQARGRAHPVSPDPRPGLGKALIDTMEGVIPFRLLKPFPALMTRYLCGTQVASELGIDQRVSGLSVFLFAGTMAITRGIDSVVRLFLPEFSIARLITRIMGYHLITQLLMDQTRPLKLPFQLLNSVNEMMWGWNNDPKAPRWMNHLEKRLTSLRNTGTNKSVSNSMPS